MAEVEKAIIDKLAATSAVTDILGSRMYVTHGPSNPTPPYLVMFRVSGPRFHSMERSSGLVSARIQMDIYGRTALEARQAAAVVRVAIDGFRGVQSGVTISAILLLDGSDGYDEEPEIRRVIQDYEVWFNE